MKPNCSICLVQIVIRSISSSKGFKIMVLINSSLLGCRMKISRGFFFFTFLSSLPASLLSAFYLICGGIWISLFGSADLLEETPEKCFSPSFSFHWNDQVVNLTSSDILNSNYFEVPVLSAIGNAADRNMPVWTESAWHIHESHLVEVWGSLLLLSDNKWSLNKGGLIKIIVLDPLTLND